MSTTGLGLFQNRAVAAGVTKPLLREVISKFYEKVRRDPMLGPIFEKAIGDHWDRHIEKVILFWITATQLGTGYKRRHFMPAHLPVAGLGPQQIARWLVLFRETLTERCPPEAGAALFDIAERMAENIQVGIQKRTATPRQP